MPFTFSHPAIVLPAKYLPEKWVSMTGLIIGSLIPDFEYFIRLKIQSEYSHTFAGMFWFDLPLGLVFTFLYHDIIRNGLVRNLPPFLQKRLSRFNDFNWNAYFKQHYLIVLLSLLIGIASHVAWDGFTHPQGFFVKMLPGLKTEVTLLQWHTHLYNILQTLSSSLGGLIVIIALLSIKPSGEYIKPKNPLFYWFLVVSIPILMVNARLLTGIKYWEYSNLAATAISGMIIGLIIAPLFLERGKQV